MTNEQSDVTEQMPLGEWQVPGLHPGNAETLRATPGEATAIVGANGAGKSALGYWLEQHAAAPVNRLIAHRQLWLESSGPELTASAREGARQNAKMYSAMANSRYVDRSMASRAAAVLFDLLSRINDRNARLANLVDAGLSVADSLAQAGGSDLSRLNRLMAASGLPIEITLTSHSTFNALNQAKGVEYPISEMSDGEKSALLLIAEVITAPAHAVIILDEPERHLHRAISVGLIEGLVSDRSDCHLIILTHDLDLAASLPRDSSHVYTLLGATWVGGDAVGWDLHSVEDHEGIAEPVRRAILGGRSKLLFLEGDLQSLDTKLYKILYPKWTLAPIGSCEEVIRAVAGLHASAQHHWVEAVGIVDHDARSDEEIAVLRSKGVRVLMVNEVESLYYAGPALAAVAQRQAGVLEQVTAMIINDAKQAALEMIALPATPQRLAAQVASSVVRRMVLAALPDATSIARAAGEDIQVSVPSPFVGILTEVQNLLRAQDLAGLLRLIPIRDTGAPGRIAQALSLRNKQDYEAIARTCIAESPQLQQELREMIGV